MFSSINLNYYPKLGLRMCIFAKPRFQKQWPTRDNSDEKLP